MHLQQRHIKTKRYRDCTIGEADKLRNNRLERKGEDFMFSYY